MRIRSIIYIFFFLLFALPVSGQYYETGQDPASLRWLQIKTDRFRVIYPETYGINGIEFARSLDKAYNDLTRIFPEKRFRIPVIIHNHTTQSNGYVAWAPKRMEIYPTPEQNTIPLDNNRQLALHELTHVMQMEALNTGFSKAMSLFFGQQFPGAMAAFLPLWYLEGDAVFAESALTESGRGRSASFQKQLKAISVENNSMYKYDKLVNGSFRHYVPDYYQTGSQAVTLAHLKYGLSTWNKVLKTTANLPFLIDPVNISLLRNTGQTKKKLFEETFDTLRLLWNEEVRSSGAQPFEALNVRTKKQYISYFSPVFISDTTIAAIRTSMADPPRFVLINTSDRSEKKIHVPGNIYPLFISAAKSLLVWVETQYDPRWDNRNYSVIKIMDVRDGSVQQLTWKSRYMAASLSHDGRTIAAVENSAGNITKLVFIDVQSSKITGTFTTPGNMHLQRPQWSDDGSEITFISLTKEGEGICSFSVSRQRWENLIDNSPTDYQSSFLRNDSLFFVSSVSGTENIYVQSPDGKVSGITNSQFGAIDPFVHKGRILFCDYTASGNNICSVSMDNTYPWDTVVNKDSAFLVTKVRIPEKKNVTGHSEKIYTPRPYHKWQHLFGFHSWMPFYADIEEVKADPASISPGFTLFSQNHLSTLISSLGYEYTDGRHKFHSRIKWQGWYPVLESGIDYGHENNVFRTQSGEDLADPVSINPGLVFSNTLSVPLTFSTGRFYQYFRPSLSANYQNRYILYIKDDTVYDYGQTEIAARFFFANYHRSSVRDIYPRIAHIFDFNYSFFPFDKDIYGSSLTLRTALYFPGILKNNGIRLGYEADKQYVEQVAMWNRINLPRGYKDQVSEELHVLLADYVMPLVYPDINLLSLFYLTRIRTGFFYDHAIGKGNYYFRRNEMGSLVVSDYHDSRETFNSLGIELMADFYVLRMPYMVSAGIRSSWKQDERSPVIEFLFSMDIFGMNIGRSRL